MNRCLNDFFAYCDTTPVRLETPDSYTYTDSAGRPVVQAYTAVTCKHDHRTCNHHLAHSQLHTRILTHHPVETTALGP